MRTKEEIFDKIDLLQRAIDKLHFVNKARKLNSDSYHNTKNSLQQQMNMLLWVMDNEERISANKTIYVYRNRQ